MTQAKENTSKYSAEEIQPSSFTLIGRVCGFEDFQTKKGHLAVRLKVSRKVMKTNEYALYTVTFFDSDDNNIASEVCAELEKGDYVGIRGDFRQNKYIPANSQKEIWEIQFTGTYYQKMIYDTEINKYVKA